MTASPDGSVIVPMLNEEENVVLLVNAVREALEDFDHARGSVLITMDGDLQNDPRDIPAMVAKLHEGYDLVAGYRERRQDRLITRRTRGESKYGPSRVGKVLADLFTIKMIRSFRIRPLLLFAMGAGVSALLSLVPLTCGVIVGED